MQSRRKPKEKKEKEKQENKRSKTVNAVKEWGYSTRLAQHWSDKKVLQAREEYILLCARYSSRAEQNPINYLLQSARPAIWAKLRQCLVSPLIVHE